MKKYAYIGALGFLAVITTEFGVIGILPQLADHYHISIDKAGYLLSAFALIIAITGPFMTLLDSGPQESHVNCHRYFLSHSDCLFIIPSCLVTAYCKNSSGLSPTCLYCNSIVCRHFKRRETK